MATAKIIKEDTNSECVTIGSKVSIQEEGFKEKESFVIVGAAEANPSEGRISNESPLGSALLGGEKGDVVNVQAPDGEYSVKIIKVS